jgi:phage shock protein A
MARPNPFVRAWKYFMSWFGAKIDEKADPKIQIQQAIQEAQNQHAQLVRQAANVIGNQRQLEMKLDRKLNEVDTLQAQAKQALVLADKARTEGNEAKAQDFEETAQMLANQLVTAEQAAEDMKNLHDQAIQAAAQAREAVDNNAALLQEKLAERTKLLSQLDQARMQETVAASLQQMSEMAAPSNVPTLDEVRDKIEQRYAVALGQADLAKNSVAGRMIEVKKATVNLEGSRRLDEIRASLRRDTAGPAPVETGATPAIENPASAPSSTTSGVPTQTPASTPEQPS